MSHAHVVERFFESLAAGDFGTALESFHEDNVIHEPTGLPYGGDYVGRQGVQDLIMAVSTLFEFEIRKWDIHEAGDGCVGVLDAIFVSRETGRRIDTKVVELYKFTEGLISDATIFPHDTRAIYELTL